MEVGVNETRLSSGSSTKDEGTKKNKGVRGGIEKNTRGMCQDNLKGRRVYCKILRYALDCYVTD